MTFTGFYDYSKSRYLSPLSHSLVFQVHVPSSRLILILLPIETLFRGISGRCRAGDNIGQFYY